MLYLLAGQVIRQSGQSSRHIDIDEVVNQAWVSQGRYYKDIAGKAYWLKTTMQRFVFGNKPADRCPDAADFKRNECAADPYDVAGAKELARKIILNIKSPQVRLMAWLHLAEGYSCSYLSELFFCSKECVAGKIRRELRRLRALYPPENA
jgi:hypothetical protein